ncbi:MAG: IS256 family transposase, partial [Holophagales bacterium]|nr:IS256 family transposase [Holophagales bacterium]
MAETTANVIAFPAESSEDALEELLREGARKMLNQAIQAEVALYLEARRELVDKVGRRQVVRNGTLPKREIQTP